MKHTDRRLFLLGAASLTLAGCSGLFGPPDAAPIYVLTPAAPPAATGPKVRWALAIDTPDASQSLDTNRIALIHQDTTLDYYADAVWPDRLTDVVQTALLAAFQTSGGIDAVAREGDALHADYALGIDIRDFTAHYAAAGAAPTVAVVLVAQMVTAHGRKVAATLTASQTAPAAADSVAAVVAAFNTALAAAVNQIVPWALALPPPAAP
jgi:cholesterol transport system auxiliary component